MALNGHITIGIVGHEAAKFTPGTRAEAQRAIRLLLAHWPVASVCSGRCHLGGVDIWAEEIARELKRKLVLFPPKEHSWEKGYKPRNVQIAEESDIVVCIVVKEYPPDYAGIRFPLCYHCRTKTHVKSGGCWTAKYAERRGKEAKWIEIGGAE